MRVTLISKAFVVGAYQRKLEALAALPDIELTALVPTSWREAEHEQFLEPVYTTGYQLLVAPLALNGSFHLHHYRRLGSLLRDARPEILHIDEEPYNLATYLALRNARRIGAEPLFFTWQNLLRNYPWPFRAMEQAAYRQCRAAIAGNREAAAVLRHKGYRGEIAVIAQFGVDPVAFSPAERPAERPFTLGYAGRLVLQKGLMVLLEALAQVRGEWQLKISGSGPLRARMEAFIASHALSERVTFLDYIPSHAMPDFYRQLDALVLPSLSTPNWKEQFGRVLIEAMASGVPVIGSDSGEIPAVVDDGGLIVPEGEADALCAAIERLQGDLQLVSALGEAGRQRVLAHFTHQQIAAKTIAVYRWLAGELSEFPTTEPTLDC
ncbi:MAG: glycosyltransferase family 4 protein [Chloroflexi bacterium]|nr:glycosyltransferase family 4 protein [Chloroflexota bacterium]